MPVFFIIPGSSPERVDYGTAPDGAIIVDNKGERPFWQRELTAAALAVVLRLHAEWYSTRWDASPVGRRAVLRDADLRDAVLRGADLRDADLRGADLRDADLRDADLTGADLRDADLRDADLTGAVLTGADLRDADLTGAVLTGADLRDADLTGAVGIASPEEEEATVAAAISAIAAEPQHWNQAVWHDDEYRPDKASAVGACGTAHCLAGWIQALLPLDHEYRKLDASDAGTRLAPRAAAAGWFSPFPRADLTARVEAAKLAKEGAK